MSDFAYPLHEECGVFGIYDRAGTEDVAAAAYSALYALQHRGQESCGIAVNDDGVITGHRDLGLVNEVFTPEVLASLSATTAHMATGHVRYATAGTRVRANAQPMIVRHGRGTMALCHNGNLTNAPQLRHKLEMNGSIFHGTSDTEVIGYLLTQNRLISPDIETAVCRTMEQIVGAYSLVIMTHTKLIAARDPNGFRPLCIGQLPDGSGWAFASESCALDAVGARFVRDVLPGEIVVADYTGLRTIRTHCGTAPHTMCVFEYIYFARPDSVIDGSCVHTARQRAGAFLALEHPVQADVVIGVPDSGLDAALGHHGVGVAHAELRHEQDLCARIVSLDGRGAARAAAADDEHVGRLPVERVVAQRGHAHGRILAAGKRDVVDDMARGILRCSHLAGAHNVVPAVKRAAQDDAVILQRRCDAAAEGFVQFSVQNGDPHNRGASQTVSRSADRLNRSNIPFFRCKVKNGACGKSAEIFLSY